MKPEYERSIKVLYVTGMYSTKYGGLEHFIIELLKRGVRLIVIYNNTPQPDTYYRDLLNLGASVYVVRGSILRRSWQTFRIVQQEKPNIIHYHFGFVVYFLFFFVKLLFPRIKQVLTQHCEYRYTSPIMMLATRICYKSLDLVISVSKGVKRGLVSKIGDSPRFIVSYLGVVRTLVENQTLKQDLHISDDCLILTSIGFDIDVKGFDILARAVSLLKSETSLPPFRVIVIGLNETEDKRFSCITKKLDVEDLFISVGIRNDVDDFLSITDVYLQPSRTEAISLSIMEALQYGIPIIGSNVGGIPEVCISDHNGLLVQKENVRELAGAIARLLTDNKIRTRFGKNALMLSENFRLDRSMSRLIRLYQDLLR